MSGDKAADAYDDQFDRGTNQLAGDLVLLMRAALESDVGHVVARRQGRRP